MLKFKNAVLSAAILSALALGACETSQLTETPTVDVAETVTLSPPPAETGIELAARIRAGEITAVQAVSAYLNRIELIDRSGPTLQSVLTLNPDAMSEAARLDAMAAGGEWVGPLHGVPVLVKDNIETREMPTTAGSMALMDNDPGRDAPIIARLREAGAIILGKTNLSEWANFRGGDSWSGWSGLGGQTKNPHSLDRDPCGSSAGSGSAMAAQLAAMTIGTETNGSIICPAMMSGIVGFKPTVGLMSRTHIVPISFTQDTAGPMVRSVADAAMMLEVMAGSDPADAATKDADEKATGYLEALKRDPASLKVGVMRWAQGEQQAIIDEFDAALEVLRDQGVTLVEIEEFEPDPVMWEHQLALLETEFKHTINAYLADADADVDARTLEDLIAFNNAHADRELVMFGQSIFISSQERSGIDDDDYLDYAPKIKQAAGSDGIDRMLEAHDVDVLIAPTGLPATPLDVAGTSRWAGDGPGPNWGMAAMAGYPSLTVPMGDVKGLPVSLIVLGTAWDDATVLALGHIYESRANAIMKPTYAAGPFDMNVTKDAMTPLALAAE